ncbi:MAG TPA: c-type cytochrome domain-containing protein [Flavisolibacter sp.]|nr:c-type cytochrome domain-containing protein [Flavisolibacter sp.]
MKKKSIITISCVGLFLFIHSCKHEPLDTTAAGGPVVVTCSADTAYFQQQVLPIFISNCALSGCHNAVSRQGGVVLTDYTTITTTGDVKAGQPNSSKIWERITETDPSKRMPRPPRNPLSQPQKDIIFKWISQGAKNNSCQSSVCDSTNVTFSGTIRSIMNNKCLGCHSSSAPQGGINYTAYAGVKAKVDDGRLWGAINHLPGFSPMPKGGAKLSDCEIAQFKKWVDAGAPNN